MSEKLYISYNFVHKLCRDGAKEILANGKPDVIVAIGGGGFIPARIIRLFLKEEGGKNIPIQAIGLSLYEQFGASEDQIGKEVVRTQWLDFGALLQHFDLLIGKNVLIVDEVDDTRTTLHYALSELQKDVARVQLELGRTSEKTTFLIFVLHNKNKPKRADLPEDMFTDGRYIAGRTVDDVWIAYPWEQQDIDTHTAKAVEQGNI